MHLSKSHHKIIFFLSLIFVFIIICIGLGFWQLSRAEYKQDLLDTFHKNSQKSINETALRELNLPSAFQKVKIKGHFDNQHIILIDNKTHQGIPGFHVIIPFISSADHHYLVNVGWYEGNADRNQIPIIPSINGDHTIEGFVVWPQKPMILKTITPLKTWPLLLQWPDIALIKQYTQMNFPDYIIWLPSDQQIGFVKDWSIEVMQPERHIAYAVQWFAMAAILLICGIIILIKTFFEKGDD